MNDKKSIGVWSYLMSPEARLTIIIPILLYNIMFWMSGVGAALLVTAFYSAIVELFSKKSGSLSIIALILVSGGIHYLYLHGYTLFGIHSESVFLSLAGSLSVIVVFGFYSLIGKPVVRTLAENARPKLFQLPVYGTKKYIKVWQEVSLGWILAYAVKGLAVILFAKDMPNFVDYFVFIGAWPLTLVMIAFSIYWPSYRWSDVNKQHAP
ncbi:hypothetical protein M9194_00365 [Vibrio sp. S4M6]|uniref:hypothetical protein n=1 Tax=Vibrio sinus TaxID=2946865 RepID=UPI002029C287|nr:hypothetical protein [Vibrio sinus]MCL9779885.1 hypothetical protein [Vibrio sinus]